MPAGSVVATQNVAPRAKSEPDVDIDSVPTPGTFTTTAEGMQAALSR